MVHIAWDKTPFFLRNLHVGKEGHPSRAYEVIVNHRWWIMSATRGFFVIVNHLTSRLFCHYKNHGFVQELHERRFSADVPFFLYDKHGYIVEYLGPYLICDNGYHKWKCLICSFKHCYGDEPTEIWSKMVESLRKDVECTFGILKGRFRIRRLQ